MTTVVGLRDPVFSPDASVAAASQLTAFMRFCEEECGRGFADYDEFDRFSVEEFRRFWLLFLRWSGLIFEGSTEPVCTDEACERAAFFPDVRLSYCENLLRLDPGCDGDRPALTACHASGERDRLSRRELRDRVVRLARSLEGLGVRPRDRVVAIAHNNAEAVVAGLATTALGATFSAAAPDMGSFTALSRFEQLEPSVLMANLRGDDERASVTLAERVAAVARGLPSLEAFVALDDGPLPADMAAPVHRLSDLIEGSDGGHGPSFPRLPFNHPLFVLFSSGTTGRPKCIVHGAGGTLLEHLKEHRLHCDLRDTDKLLFHTSAAWMMWNWQLSALACGAEIVLYDGPVTGPDTLWRLASEQRVTVLGTSPPYLQLCQDAGFSPREALALPALRTVLSTGSILGDRQYDWAREHVGRLPLQSISGGTDIIGCFVLGNPNLPVYRGECQCRSLGLDVHALPEPDAAPGSAIGELVCANPFPSRPVGFHGDTDGTRFHDAYFRQNPGVWTHGDLVEITETGGARLHGRSDGVLNVSGFRIGPAEIYRILEDVPAVRKAMAVEQRPRKAGGGSRIVLLVVARVPGALDDQLEVGIRRELGRRGSPAHVPALIVEVDELPTTHSGKPSEQAARDAVNGVRAANVEALRNPACLEAIERAVAQRAERPAPAPADAASGVHGRSPNGRLEAIWEEVVRASSIRPDDNFFDLGGTSLLAIRLFAAIHDRLGIDANPAILFHAPTLAGLSALLRDGREPLSPLVLLRQGRGRPLFLVPGIYGDVFDVRTLALTLRSRRPLYGLARGLDPAQPRHSRIEAMADYYIDHLVLRQPAGPYAITGFSFGGLVAFEIARRLREQGEQVDFLGLIDTDVHPGCLTRWCRRWFRATWRARRVRELVSHPRTELLPFAQRRGSRFIPGLSSPPLPDEALLPVRRWLAEDAWEAFDAYRPRPYDGSATLFRATRRRARHCDPLPVWRSVVGGGLSVREISGEHPRLVLPPHVGELANALAAQLPDVNG